jgi:hypothetical protein
MWWRMFVDPLPKSVGPQQFLSGSNWMSVTARRSHSVRGGSLETDHVGGFLDTVGVQSNGTLWISSKAAPEIWTGDKMVQFGDETNWQQVIRSYGASFGSFLLLKNNGTLWRWGTTNYDWSQSRTNWPSARTFTPRQIGTNSDWKEIFNDTIANARKTNGSAWVVVMDSKTKKDEMMRQTNFDQIPSQTYARASQDASAYVAADGTLWLCDRHANESGGLWEGTGFLQVGKETNWLSVAVTWASMVALKSDGSLWKWNLSQSSTAETAKIPPTRLGIHNDWVALAGTWGGAISIAADGSLWLWPDASLYYEAALLKIPKQPQLLGNVFGKAD